MIHYRCTRCNRLFTIQAAAQLHADLVKCQPATIATRTTMVTDLYLPPEATDASWAAAGVREGLRPDRAVGVQGPRRKRRGAGHARRQRGT